MDLTKVKKKKQQQPTVYEPPKRLSKMAEWRRKNPDGILIIKDMRAVMK